MKFFEWHRPLCGKAFSAVSLTLFALTASPPALAEDLPRWTETAPYAAPGKPRSFRYHSAGLNGDELFSIYLRPHVEGLMVPSQHPAGSVFVPPETTEENIFEAFIYDTEIGEACGAAGHTAAAALALCRQERIELDTLFGVNFMLDLNPSGEYGLGLEMVAFGFLTKKDGKRDAFHEVARFDSAENSKNFERHEARIRGEREARSAALFPLGVSGGESSQRTLFDPTIANCTREEPWHPDGRLSTHFCASCTHELTAIAFGLGLSLCGRDDRFQERTPLIIGQVETDWHRAKKAWAAAAAAGDAAPTLAFKFLDTKGETYYIDISSKGLFAAMNKGGGEGKSLADHAAP